MRIFKHLFITVRIKKAVVLIGFFLLLYFIWYSMYVPTYVTSIVLKQKIVSNEFTDLEKLNFKNNLKIVKTRKPSGIQMLYNHSCPFQIDKLPQVDIQMLNLYQKPDFNKFYAERPYKKQLGRHKLKVYVVPHSHNDPGWRKTFESYYHSTTKHILNTMIQKLPEDPKRKFIWAEISLFSMWWDSLGQNDKEIVKKLIRNNQLEFVTGGWVMNDEASTHWISTVYQISEGHKWLKLHLNYTPKSHWSIDPFGLGATQPMLLKQMGFENMLIQRVHYAVKNYFGNTKNLEFRWKQIWDNTGETEIFTQLMPYSSYSIASSCGPNSGICYKFDYRRLSWSWPWRMIYSFKYKLPEPITDINVAQKAELLLDQLRKKSTLFKTDVLLVPLGNDFTYSSPEEFDVQFQNFEKLFNFMNSNSKMHIEIQFGTLSDYFDAVHLKNPNNNFPTLTGDFFTYSVEDNTYWSGYYTSRPFYKRMDRELLSYTRAAEIILTLAHLNKKPGFQLTVKDEARLLNLLTEARRALALFQHHDAITGTSREHVVADYGKKMFEAIEKTKDVIQYCTNLLLLAPWADIPLTDTVRYNIDEIRHRHDSLPEQHIINVTPTRSRKVVLFNSLPYSRHEIVSIMVDTPFVEVLDFNDKRILCQVSPVFEHKLIISDSKYVLLFTADVPALGLIAYTIKALDDKTAPLTMYSSIKLFNQIDQIEIPAPFPKVIVPPETKEFKLQNDHITAIFNNFGLLKTLTIDGYTTPVNLNFAIYGPDYKSGAYLFVPDGEAVPINLVNTITVKVIEGPLLQSVTVELPYIHHTVTLFNTPGADNLGLQIENIVDISQTSNTEIVMRLYTKISNGPDFFTDLNGYQVIRRKYLQKLPFAANYYPMSTMVYIEDATARLTVLTGTPLGCTSPSEGKIEIMLDRRLKNDDELGLGEGVMDNHPTKHIFKIILEKRKENCKVAIEDHPAGFPSLRAHVASQSLLNPLIRMLDIDSNVLDMLEFYSPTKMEFGMDFVLASLRNDVVINHQYCIGIVLLRQHLDVCFADESLLKQFPLSSGLVNISGILPVLEEDVSFNKTSLSFLNIYEGIHFQNDIAMCPMEIQAFILYT